MRALFRPTPLDGVLQVAHREARVEERQDGLGNWVVRLHLDELQDVALLVVERVVHRSRGEREACRRVDGDAMLGVDRAGAELDRRDVPLAASAQAHDEADRAARHAVLVRVRDHRRVEERDRFERILVGEVGAEEQAALLARLGVLAEQRDRGRVVLPENPADVLVPLPVVGDERREHRRDLRVGERAHAVDDGADPRRPARNEGASDDSAGIGGEAHRQAGDVHGPL